MGGRSRAWGRFARRWAVAGVACGALAALVGCRATAPDDNTPTGSPAPLYPGLPRAPAATVWHESAPVVPASQIEPPNHQAVLAAFPGGASAEETLDLGIALRLAGVENPTINLARERIQEALAEQLAARSLLLPTVNIGGNYHLHNGNLQTSSGLIRNLDSEQSLYLGFGARSLAAESVAYPGIRLFAHLGDAVYEPLAARQRVAARRSDAGAVQNDILLRVVSGYLELIGAEARLEVLQQGEVDVMEVARLTRVFVEKKAGRQADADRAAARADLVRRDLRRAEEEVSIASARLCQLLSLDPSIRLRSPGGGLLPVHLIPEDAETEPLIVQALRTRPEVFARAAEVAEAQVRVRQEKIRPLVPLVSVGVSGGWFGGGASTTNPAFGDLKGRTDIDAFAVWNIQNLGFGNRAQVRRADAIMGETIARYDRTINQIRREVLDAQTDARVAAQQLEAAKSAVATAEEEFKLERLRIAQGQGLPIEILDSFQQLLDSRQELFRAVVAYNVAQFRLFVAMGSDPRNGSPFAPIPVPTPRP